MVVPCDTVDRALVMFHSFDDDIRRLHLMITSITDKPRHTTHGHGKQKCKCYIVIIVSKMTCHCAGNKQVKERRKKPKTGIREKRSDEILDESERWSEMEQR